MLRVLQKTKESVGHKRQAWEYSATCTLSLETLETECVLMFCVDEVSKAR